jgi:hypothetical protein
MEKNRSECCIGTPSEWMARLMLASSVSSSDRSEVVLSLCKLASMALRRRYKEPKRYDTNPRYIFGPKLNSGRAIATTAVSTAADLCK